MTQNTPVIDLPNGLKLSLRDPQEVGCANYIIKEVFHKSTYSRPGFEIDSGDTVVDIGGNIGVFALWAAPQAKRVISVEPMAMADCLQASIHLNGLQNVEVVRSAVSDKNGTMELMVYPGFNAVSHSTAFTPSRWGQFFIKLLWRKQQADPEPMECTCHTLQQILEERVVEKVDLLKIDCEGGEYAVFDSIDADTLRRISRIAMEFHELHTDHSGNRLADQLRTAGYDVTIQRSLLDRVLGTGMIWARRPA